MNNFNFKNLKSMNEKLKGFKVQEGGEGTIYNIGNGIGIKIFNPQEVNMKKKEKKVTKMMKYTRTEGFNNIITPINLVTVNEHFIGYTMRFIDNAINLDRIADKSFMDKSNLKYCLRIMIKIAESIEKIHNMNIIIGDLHPGQIIISGGDIYFVDTDSWGWDSQEKLLLPDLKCFPAYVDPIARDFYSKEITVKKYVKENDYYSLAVIAFEVLTGVHPFGGVYQIYKNMPCEMRAKCKLSVLGNHNIKIINEERWKIWITDELKEAFLDIFERKKRYNIKEALIHQYENLKYCSIHEKFYNSKYSECPICNPSTKQSILPLSNVNNKEKIFLDNKNVKKLYDSRTYFNKQNMVIHIDDHGNEMKRIINLMEKNEIYFLENKEYYIKIKPLSKWNSLIGQVETNNICDLYIYRNNIRIYKIRISYKDSIKIYKNSVFYIENDFGTYALKKLSIVNNDVYEKVIIHKLTYFEYIVEQDSNYVIIIKNEKNIEIDFNGQYKLLLPRQKLIAIKYDKICNIWICILKKSKIYRTIMIKNLKKIFETSNINYEGLNLKGSVFHKATLCIPDDQKIIFIMPFVPNIPVDGVITETDLGVMTRNSTLEIRKNRSNQYELYVLKEDNSVYKFIM